ncbi:MAG: NYN domain-containing protein [Candidatus Taylorbacteria bacterium]
MDIQDFKREYIVGTELGIDATFGKILTVIDFGNVNYWFDEDRQDAENKALQEDEKLRIKLDGLYDFVSLFSDHIRFYYGHDSEKKESLAFISAARHVFGKRVYTKPMQKVRHHLSADEIESNKRATFTDNEGVYIHLPKCNFDVEISVDLIRLMDRYDTVALFSGDADFVSLIRYLKKNSKKVILFKAGFITTDLKEVSDKIINAQNIKRHIAEVVKQKPGVKPGLANR